MLLVIIREASHVLSSAFNMSWDNEISKSEIQYLRGVSSTVVWKIFLVIEPQIKFWKLQEGTNSNSSLYSLNRVFKLLHSSTHYVSWPEKNGFFTLVFHGQQTCFSL